MNVQPIGWVRSPRTEPDDGGWDAIASTITLDSTAFGAEALMGLDDFSHIEVVFVFDRVDPNAVTTSSQPPRENLAWPEVGIFAQRGSSRPNRLGVSVCRLESVEGITLTVRGLDAIDKTPVLDIKPYLIAFGARGEVRQPGWAHEVTARYW
ncbi:MAG: tRNA (adenine37-N6)-methyltransferase [Pseudonocardiales bacterium]|nr:tRNA (adenine37-N6)-methyltransferase [Pseudonocardiales bacterium]